MSIALPDPAPAVTFLGVTEGTDGKNLPLDNATEMQPLHVCLLTFMCNILSHLSQAVRRR